MRFVFTVNINIIILRSYKLFSGLNILDSRLRGSDSNEGFVIPADAGIQFLFCNHRKKKYSNLRIIKNLIILYKIVQPGCVSFCSLDIDQVW